MKIGFDAKRAFHNSRGLGNYSRDLISGLSKYYPENEYYLFTPPINDESMHKWATGYSNLRIVEPDSYFSKKISSLWRSFSIAKEVQKRKLDIYHGLSHELPVGIDSSGVKSVVTIHDLIFLRYPDYFPFIDRKIYLKKFKYSCEKADLIIAICEQTKSDIIEFLGIKESKIKVVYQTCNPRFYTLMDEDKLRKVVSSYGISGKFILNVGALEERKNALNLVKAYARLKKEINHHLVLIGNGKKYRTQIENYIESKNLGDRVTILDNVSHRDLPAFYQAADLFCYPSHFEGFGIPIIEALFSKTPVITSKGSCFPESGGPKSIYIDSKSIEELTEKMTEVLTNSDLAYQMIEEGRNYVEKFHRSKTSECLFNIYKELINS